MRAGQERREMNRSPGILLLVLSLCLLWGPIGVTSTASLVQYAYSQETEDGYRLRQDEFDPRKEGIKEHRTKPVCSDKIVLLSALIKTALAGKAPMPDVIRLGFYTEEKTRASVEIIHEPKLYYVDPIRQEWGPGLATFRWPTTIIQRYEISPDELYARATFIERGERTVFPACLYFEDPPGVVEEYRFVVAPLREMLVQYWIVDLKADTIVVAGTQQSIAANEHRLITWDGTDRLGREVPEGEYLLKLEGTYKPRFEKKRKVPVSYRFFHKTRLGK
jgi:hypothetical protein